MVLVSYSGREINAKLVYYGPGLSGKTTNLEYIYASIPQTQRGKMVSMKTKTERTLFFDFLPVNLGELAGFKTRFLLYTVPGQVYYNATRKLVLKGVDAVVFVADSSRGKMDENVESLENLRENLAEHGLSLDELPWVLQYNKRDLPDVYSIRELDAVLNPGGLASFEAVAKSGQGVVETFKGVSRLLLRKLAREIGVTVVSPSAGIVAPVGVTPSRGIATPAGMAPSSGVAEAPAAAGASRTAEAGLGGSAGPAADSTTDERAATSFEPAPAAAEPETEIVPARPAVVREATAESTRSATSFSELTGGTEPGSANGRPLSVGEKLRRWLTRPVVISKTSAPEEATPSAEFPGSGPEAVEAAQPTEATPAVVELPSVTLESAGANETVPAWGLTERLSETP